VGPHGPLPPELPLWAPNRVPVDRVSIDWVRVNRARTEGPGTEQHTASRAERADGRNRREWPRNGRTGDGWLRNRWRNASATATNVAAHVLRRRLGCQNGGEAHTPNQKPQNR
jgi:hypothetical protein